MAAAPPAVLHGGRGAMIRHSAGLPLTGLVALVLLWAPLPFGSVTPWATALLQVAGPLALALALLPGPGRRSIRPVAVPAAALAGLAILGGLQSLAWPSGLARLVSPRHAAFAAEGAAGVPLSLAPSASQGTALTLAALAAVLVAAAVVGRQRHQRRVLAVAVVVAAVFVTLYGLRGWFARATTIWSVSVPSDASRLRGTFVNANHFAAYLELVLPVVLALCWWAVRRARYEVRLEPRLLLVAPPVILWLALFVCLAFTGSRAGLAASLFGTAVAGALLGASRRRWWPAAAGGALALVGVVAVGVTGLRQGFGRWVAASGLEAGLALRREVYAAALELWARFPATGVGLGAFREGFPMVQPPQLQGAWWHVESDLLELLVTAGLVGVGVALVGLVALVGRLWRVLRWGERSEDRAAALAALGVLASLLVHEAVDFSLTMPANAFTLAILAGAAAGAPAPQPPPPGSPREV